MKIIFFSNTSWFLFNFNKVFALKLMDLGHKVIFIAPVDKFSNKIIDLGIEFVAVPMHRDSINPFHQIFVVSWIIKFLLNEKPDVLHNFTLKSVFLGSIAAQISGIKCIVNELTGLGFVFTSESLKAKVLRFFSNLLFRIIFITKSTKLVLLNSSDYNFFLRKKNILNNSVFLILGVGVDCNYFSPVPQIRSGNFKVLLPARVLWDKGILEFVEASKIIKNSHNNIDFLIAGDVDNGNPSAVDIPYLNFNEKKGYIRWLGHVDDIRELYRTIDLVVLPSYREGLPTSLTEAASCGLPLITTDVPGCRDVVEDGVNGLVVPPKNFQKLAEAIVFLFENPQKCKVFGTSSRIKSVKKFSEEVIFNQRFQLYNIK